MILDIGANIGYFTKTLIEWLGLEGRAELYEPLPRLAEFCRRTVATLPCQATAHEFGLSNEEATLDISWPRTATYARTRSSRQERLLT